MNTYKLFWSPEGKCIATVQARDMKAAVRKAPKPYRKYLGEIYAELTIPAAAPGSIAEVNEAQRRIDVAATKYYFLHTDREHYRVSINGFISRACMDWKYSGQWRLRGLERRNNFGYRVEFVPFPKCMEITDMRYKNGQPKWAVCDFDHGTDRVWGEPLRVVGVVQ